MQSQCFEYPCLHVLACGLCFLSWRLTANNCFQTIRSNMHLTPMCLNVCMCFLVCIMVLEHEAQTTGTHSLKHHCIGQNCTRSLYPVDKRNKTLLNIIIFIITISRQVTTERTHFPTRTRALRQTECQNSLQHSCF